MVINKRISHDVKRVLIQLIFGKKKDFIVIVVVEHSYREARNSSMVDVDVVRVVGFQKVILKVDIYSFGIVMIVY